MDEAHIWTDEQIEGLQKEFRKVYRRASVEMRVKLGKFMEEFDKANTEWIERVKKDASKNDQYQRWLRGRAAEKGWIRRMTNVLVSDAVHADQLAAERIYDTVPTVYTENANRAAFAIQQGVGRRINEFELVDVDTVRYLIENQPELLPKMTVPRFDKKRDTKWNTEKFTNEITQSVLQGESVQDTARRLQRVLNMDEATALRSARTALTSAENAGRVQSYRRAQGLGLEFDQEWQSAADGRTRVWHVLLDGERAKVGDMFHVPGMGKRYDIEYPCWPGAVPEMIYNCRCCLETIFPDSQPIGVADRWMRLPDNMTYSDWKEDAARQAKEMESERRGKLGVVGRIKEDVKYGR